MGERSPERLITAEHQEKEISLLDFGDLKIGDQVVLSFIDGRAYWLLIDHQDEEGTLLARVNSGRKSQLAAEIENWEERPDPLKIKGSCERLLVENRSVSVVGAIPGFFVAGKSAWFGITTEKGEKDQVLPQIQRIQYFTIS